MIGEAYVADSIEFWASSIQAVEFVFTVIFAEPEGFNQSEDKTLISIRES